MEIDLDDLKKIKKLGKRVEGIITNELNDIFKEKQMLESFFMVIDSLIASYYLKVISAFKEYCTKDIDAVISLFDKAMIIEFDSIRAGLKDKMNATKTMIIDENPEAMINALKEFKELDPKNGDEIDELISEFKKL